MFKQFRKNDLKKIPAQLNAGPFFYKHSHNLFTRRVFVSRHSQERP